MSLLASVLTLLQEKDAAKRMGGFEVVGRGRSRGPSVRAGVDGARILVEGKGWNQGVLAAIVFALSVALLCRRTPCRIAEQAEGVQRSAIRFSGDAARRRLHPWWRVK